MSETARTSESILGIPEIEVEIVVDHEVPWPVDPTLSTSGMAADAKVTGEQIANVMVEFATLLENVFPVGSIYTTTAAELPAAISAVGTWTEVLMPMTWNDAKVGSRSYTPGTGTGTVHFWQRTA